MASIGSAADLPQLRAFAPSRIVKLSNRRVHGLDTRRRRRRKPGQILSFEKMPMPPSWLPEEHDPWLLAWGQSLAVTKTLSLSAVLFQKAGPVQIVRVYLYRLRYADSQEG